MIFKTQITNTTNQVVMSETSQNVNQAILRRSADPVIRGPLFAIQFFFFVFQKLGDFENTWKPRKR